MKPIPLLSLASGVMPGASPVATIDAAASAGFQAVGIWVEPREWTPGTTREVRSRLESSGVAVLDVEVIWIRPGAFDPDHLRIIDIGAEIGCPNALVVSSDPDRSATIDKYARVCEHAHGAGIRASFEFAPFTEVPTLDDALAIVEAVNCAAAALLVDPFHLHRSGGGPSDIDRVPRSLLRYAQFCDAAFDFVRTADRAAMRQQAIDERCCPGEGSLPLLEFFEALPAGTPLSVEVRSKRLRDAFPDCNERAGVVANATRAWFDRRQARLLTTREPRT